MLTLPLVFVVTILLGVPVAFCLGLAGIAFHTCHRTGAFQYPADPDFWGN
jgi:hypothetical protein